MWTLVQIPALAFLVIVIWGISYRGCPQCSYLYNGQYNIISVMLVRNSHADVLNTRLALPVAGLFTTDNLGG